MSQTSAAAVGAALGGAFIRQPSATGGPTTCPAPPQVVRIRSDQVLRANRVDRRVLREMIDVGVAAALGAADAAEAWTGLLKPDDVIALKFNRSAADALGTTLPMAAALIGSLVDAGFDPAQLVPVEVPPQVYEETGTSLPEPAWASQETDFGSGQDELAGLLDQVTAIINVPFLKTHNIAGLTCCLKNLSHALIKHPARYHGNGCCPYIADIVAVPQIRNKLRLHLVNGLKIVHDGGPEAAASGVALAAALLVGVDPVAIDTAGLETINHERTSSGLQPIRPPMGKLGYLGHAEKIGLGCAELHSIDLVRLTV